MVSQPKIRAVPSRVAQTIAMNPRLAMLCVALVLFVALQGSVAAEATGIDVDPSSGHDVYTGP